MCVCVVCSVCVCECVVVYSLHVYNCDTVYIATPCLRLSSLQHCENVCRYSDYSMYMYQSGGDFQIINSHQARPFNTAECIVPNGYSFLIHTIMYYPKVGYHRTNSYHHKSTVIITRVELSSQEYSYHHRVDPIISQQVDHPRS